MSALWINNEVLTKAVRKNLRKEVESSEKGECWERGPEAPAFSFTLGWWYGQPWASSYLSKMLSEFYTLVKVLMVYCPFQLAWIPSSCKLSWWNAKTWHLNYIVRCHVFSSNFLWTETFCLHRKKQRLQGWGSKQPANLRMILKALSLGYKQFYLGSHMNRWGDDSLTCKAACL